MDELGSIDLSPPQDGHSYYLGTCKANDSGQIYPCWERETIYMQYGDIQVQIMVAGMVVLIISFVLVVFLRAYERIENYKNGKGE